MRHEQRGEFQPFSSLTPVDSQGAAEALGSWETPGVLQGWCDRKGRQGPARSQGQLKHPGVQLGFPLKDRSRRRSVCRQPGPFLKSSALNRINVT